MNVPPTYSIKTYSYLILANKENFNDLILILIPTEAIGGL